MTTEEYNQSVDEYSDAVYRFMLKNTQNEELAKDIVQESFTKMWIKRKEIDGKKARSYLFSTAYHQMIDVYRKENRKDDFETVQEQNYAHDDQYSDLSEVLSEAVKKLPEIQRSVLMLRDYEGYSYQEIGEITKLNESQVKVYIYRARLYLKKYIGAMENVI
ncbi:MAG TPA: RNA polymerase sigma factor [Salinivirga sp.]|uniref:RNA polymerase sigma factor YlaC n=1 Tax=Salinivirga cyanobacteriivorans TaxID=1307839 RepID=A0A0S2I013_9BACT|nr:MULTISPECIES: RNA polymerase sigma factor [Salinivirga]ALO15617.1 RNA polymerase sigma factor YlaC [Salinivirga cyanobacteriivorans]HKK58221.1 RNA polymerase sigma factor [Salinivirga sp.]